MNNLIIFDIDGTLIHYIENEDKAYLESIYAVVGIDNINTKWDDYHYSTESGILSEIFCNSLKRNPNEAELLSIKERYASYLSKDFKINPHALKCIPGARSIFNLLKEMNWDIAIATGGWHETALMKLDGADIPRHNIPLAHGGDHYERENIIRTAVSRAKHFYNRDCYHKTIYVGDRMWDLKATQSLEMGFIGIGAHLKAVDQRNFIHFDDYESNAFLEYLKNSA